MAHLGRVRKAASVTERTYRALERAISQNKLLPGQPLVIADLAEELGVSRTPVREALLMLEKAGLVETANGRMTVAGLSTVDLDEVFEFREAIELFCIEKVAERAAKDRLAPLRFLLDVQAGTDARLDAAAAAAADLRFHRAVVALADNERLLAAWDQVATHLQRFWQEGRANLSRVRSDLEECVAILDALQAGDAKAASRVLRDHLRDTKAALSAWNDGGRAGR